MVLIYGNEPYLINYELSKLRKKYDETEVYHVWTDEIRNALFQLPVLGKEKNIIILLPELQEGMEILTDAPCNICLVVEKLDKRRKIYQHFSKCRQIPCNKVSASTLENFILRECSRNSVNIREDAFRLFLSRIQYQENESTNLYKIQTCIRQMCFSVKEEQLQCISMEQVNAFVPETVQEQAYHLTNALFQGNSGVYMKLVTTLIKEKDGICMMSALLRTFRLAYKAALYHDKTAKEREALFKVPSYQYAAVQQLSLPDIQICMDILMNGIDEIKSGNGQELCFIKTMSRLWRMVSTV